MPPSRGPGVGAALAAAGWSGEEAHIGPPSPPAQLPYIRDSGPNRPAASARWWDPCRQATAGADERKRFLRPPDAPGFPECTTSPEMACSATHYRKGRKRKPQAAARLFRRTRD